MPRRRDDWLDDDEYPDDRDVDELGDDSPYDDDPLTIGRVRGITPPFWTQTRIAAAIILAILVIGYLLSRSLF